MKKNLKKKSAGAKEKSKAVTKVRANAKLVNAIVASETAKEEYASSLVRMLEIVESEQLSHAEVTASWMEARGVTLGTAESQATRILNLKKKPELVQALQRGEITLREANKQASKRIPKSKDSQKTQLNKRMARALSQWVDCIKEAGHDRQTALNTAKAALIDGGVK